MPIAAKDKPQDICKGMLLFDGEVIKDKSTKQKVPTGNGKLFIRKSQTEDNVAIVGKFDGNNVFDASFYIDEEGSRNCYWNGKLGANGNKGTIFRGTLSYDYTYNKQLKELQLVVNLLDGEIIGRIGDMVNFVPVSAKDNIKYRMAFKNGDWIPFERRFNIFPPTIKFISNEISNSNKYSFSPLIPLFIESEWSAEEGNGSWEIKWVSGKLKNGIDIQAIGYKSGYCDEFSLSGSNGVSMSTNTLSGKLPLADGGYFSWAGGESMRLYYPTGEVFDGSFERLPFDIKSLEYFNAHNKATAAMQIMESTVSDFTIADGTYTNSTGKRERVKNGKFIDRLLNNHNNGLDYATLISGAKLLSANYDDYKNLCKRDFWEYIGKGNISELDKEIYKKTPEYAERYRAYQEALNGLFYEVVSCYASDFSTNGANVYKQIDLGESAARNLPLLPIDRNNYWQSALPIKSTCVASGNYSRVKFPINSTDIDFLKYLQDANEIEELALLCIMKPGTTIEYNPYDAVPTAVGLYLINKNSYTILADFSKYLDTTDPNKYKGIFKQINAKDKAASKRKADAEMREYQQRYGKNASPCPACLGNGSLTYWGNGGSYKKTCRTCGGTGRIYKR